MQIKMYKQKSFCNVNQWVEAITRGQGTKTKQIQIVSEYFMKKMMNLKLGGQHRESEKISKDSGWGQSTLHVSIYFSQKRWIKILDTVIFKELENEPNCSVHFFFLISTFLVRN